MINHPFLDGNKGTAYVRMRLILLDYGQDILANQDDKYKMVISASTGEMKFEAIKNWIQARLKNKYDE
ncbi:type II toxin-antitoxin system death-on-curing family toxin [Flavobacterium sp.]|uniref:type II toxin-antitoxin system death-on-curing family toxin n=1 Tax=Flavobacterium sp. TaxID=239 RepID=UPI00262922D8|nr:type II toxin-antitoxin system death-on-curing family toxin [Flavobacterium sp.]